jgi:hypothetical protein
VETAAEQQQKSQKPAALTSAPTSESDISAAVAELRSADAGTLRQVEPLASCLPLDRFQAVVEKLKGQRLSSVVRNDAGLFVFLLRLELDEMRRERAAAVAAMADAAPPVESRIERIKRTDPARYIAAMKDTPGFDVEAYLTEHVADEVERQRLRRTA